MYLPPQTTSPNNNSAWFIFLSHMNFPLCAKRLAYYLDILIGFLNNGFVSTWPFTPRAVADGRGKSGCKLFRTIDRSFRLPDGI